MGPPTGWYRLRLLRQIGDQLVSGVEQFLLINNVVTVEDGPALVPGQTGVIVVLVLIVIGKTATCCLPP